MGDGLALLKVLDPGFLTTVQDGPRYGLARFGLSEAGAAAPWSLRIANFLAGNDEVLPSLELTMKPPRLLFREAARIAFGGADFGWKLDGKPLDPREAVDVRAGATLQGDYCRTGLRGYIAFSGGIQGERWHGSAATHVEARMGGMRLERDAELRLGSPGTARRRRLAEAMPGPMLVGGVKTLRVVAGPQAGLFPPEALSLLCGSLYRVTEHSSRMAVRLEGLALPASTGALLSAGAWWGAVQVPPSGVPQILGCEHPATGGYPILATVIEADRETLGQLRPREELRFGRVSLETAVELARRMEEWWKVAAVAKT